MSKNKNINNPDPIERTADLSVDEIVPDPNQPRKTFTSNEIDSLRRSITAAGQISPIVVRQSTEENYVIMGGERRFSLLMTLLPNKAHRLL
jgi:ParB family chromosome partitioning protein